MIKRHTTPGSIVTVTNPATGTPADATIKWVSPTGLMFTVKLHDDARTTVYAFAEEV